jgi:formylglycine-generating enzyme required for sulfatase activity
LKQLQEWLKENGDSLSPLEAEFVKASQNVKRQERFRLAALGSVGLMLLLVAVLGVTGQLNPFIYQPIDIEGYWVTIPAGEFQMGSENTSDDEKPVHAVFVNEFQIGKYEVTNRQYNQCLRAGVCTGSIVPVNLDHPVVNLNWHAAKTYCEWVGGRLPTEAEWEKAASWDNETKSKRRYPWGETIDCEYANYYGQDGGNDSCIGFATPVGRYERGKSPYGLYDMAGNVWEWVSSSYMPYPYDSNDGREEMDSTDVRVLRGGSWGNSDFYLRSAVRYWVVPENSFNNIGFRCARDFLQ